MLIYRMDDGSWKFFIHHSALPTLHMYINPSKNKPEIHTSYLNVKITSMLLSLSSLLLTAFCVEYLLVIKLPYNRRFLLPHHHHAIIIIIIYAIVKTFSRVELLQIVHSLLLLPLFAKIQIGK